MNFEGRHFQKLENQKGKANLNKNYLPPFLLEPKKAYRMCDLHSLALWGIGRNVISTFQERNVDLDD